MAARPGHATRQWIAFLMVLSSSRMTTTAGSEAEKSLPPSRDGFIARLTEERRGADECSTGRGRFARSSSLLQTWDGRPGGMFIAGWAELISVWTAAKTGRLILIAMDKKSTVATLRLPETLTKCGASVTTRLALALAIPRAREACFSSKVRHRLTSVRYPRVTVQLNQSLSRTPRRTQQSITQLMDRH